MSAPWALRIERYSEEVPEDILGSPFNWRRHPGAQQDSMVTLFEELGWLAPVIVNETTGALINGHMRVELAMRHGMPRIPVAWVRLSEADEKKAILTFDSIGAMAGADGEALAMLLSDTEGLMPEMALGAFLTSLAEMSPERSTTPQAPRTPQEVCCPSCGSVFVPEKRTAC